MLLLALSGHAPSTYAGEGGGSNGDACDAVLESSRWWCDRGVCCSIKYGGNGPDTIAGDGGGSTGDWLLLASN
jgi:hypothetical protein